MKQIIASVRKIIWNKL